MVGGVPRLFGDDASKVAGKLIVHSELPFNAEPPVDALVKSWITPVDSFYVRNHGNVPKIDAGAYRLSISGLVETPGEFSLAELRERFPRVAATATMTCAGNRRAEFSAEKTTPGVQWNSGAIGNAEWSGAELSALLKHCGVKAGAKHVWFEGLDECRDGDTKFPFGGSIPIEKAIGDHPAMPGCILADTMNGQPLTPNHGAPLRTVVPGFIGARSVKWLAKLVVSDRPSPNHYVADAYKMVRESTPATLASAEPIYAFVRNAVIVSVAKTADGLTSLRGYALPAGAGRNRLTAVEVTCDRWDRWEKAKFDAEPKPFCWALWSAALRLPADATRVLVRAVDPLGVQPEKAEWNAKGYQYNGWQAVDLKKG